MLATETLRKNGFKIRSRPCPEDYFLNTQFPQAAKIALDHSLRRKFSKPEIFEVTSACSSCLNAFI
jgi:predicted secreted protein